MATAKIQMTKDYRIFTRDTENRHIEAARHKKLAESMRRYGFLQSFPIVVRHEGGRLIVKDGQHRMTFAESLGLPVYYVVEAVDFDIAAVNSTAKTWLPKDYAKKYADNGGEAYTEGLAFAEHHGLSIGAAFSLLAGTTCFGNVQEQFTDGTFAVTDRAWAEDVACLYSQIVGFAPTVKGSRFVGACMALCRVKEFKVKRMIQAANRRRELLVSFSTRAAYLVMLEDVYNYGQPDREKIGLKLMATNAMRERSAVKKPKRKAA